MKILMPFPDFEKSASILDNEALVDQFWFIHSLLLAFHNNAAVPSSSENWRGYDNALCMHGIALARELEARGGIINRTILRGYLGAKNQTWTMPPWFGDEEIHAYDRALLLKQNPDHYKKFYWRVKNI